MKIKDLQLVYKNQELQLSGFVQLKKNRLVKWIIDLELVLAILFQKITGIFSGVTAGIHHCTKSE